MTPFDQEQLFEKVQKRFKLWTPWEASGYVHGVVRGLTCREPPHIYVERFLDNEPYAFGFIYGFIDAYGSDVFTAKWIQKLELSEAILNYRWWENDAAFFVIRMTVGKCGIDNAEQPSNKV